MVLSPRSTHPSSSRFAHSAESNSHSGCSPVAGQALVARSHPYDDRQAHQAAQPPLHSAGDRDERVFGIPSLESGYLQDIRCALRTRGCSDILIKQLTPGLPQDGDSKWRAYKRYCSLVETPTWTVSVYGDFSFSHAVSQLSEFLAYRRDTGTGTYSDVANHRSAVAMAYVTIFSCPSPSEDPLISRLVWAIKKKTQPQPRYPIDQAAWDPSVIIEYWLTRPDNDELALDELALKSWSLWGVATWPRPSDGSKLVRSTLRRDPPVRQTGVPVLRHQGAPHPSLHCSSVHPSRCTEEDLCRCCSRDIPLSHLWSRISSR